jgi:hypothetical protein
MRGETMAKADDMIDDVIRGRGDMSMFMLILQGIVERDCARLRDPVVVELGVRSGNSTLALLNALDRIGRGRLYSVDIEPCEGAHATILAADLYDRWYFKLGDSVPFSKDVGPCDIVFVDTSHEYQQTILEIDAWSPLVNPGGKMIFHDTLSLAWCEVRQSIYLPSQLFTVSLWNTHCFRDRKSHV